MQKYIEKNKCRVCGSALVETLDLNEQPLANSYHKGEKLHRFPLKLNTCQECQHCQLSAVVNPDLMFKDYLYVSGTSKTLHEYFSHFTFLCEGYTTNRTVLDIACNDGTQLDKFKLIGWETYGVDPAENLFPISSKNHNVVCEYWNEQVAKSFDKQFGVIIAQNVFAHVDDIHGFLKACIHVMDDESHLFIQTSQADMILNNEFDTIYHEHLSFFNAKSMKKCANLNGFSLVDVFKTEVHGGSYVFVLKRGEYAETVAKIFIQKEENDGLYEMSTYVEYSKKCEDVVLNLKQKIEQFKNAGFKVVGYGAAAKGNTLLNFAEIDLDYIVDDNPLKCGLKTPGRNIDIKNPKVLKEEDPEKTVIVPLAWNFFKEISEKTIKIMDSKPKFIKYFPEVKII